MHRQAKASGRGTGYWFTLVIGVASACGSSRTPGEPLLIRSPSSAPSLSMAAHTCVVADGRVACWGYDHFRQLGRVSGERCTTLACDPWPCWLDGVDSAATVIAGESSTCMIDRNRTLACWGAGQAGQLGAEPSARCGNDLNQNPCSDHPSQIALADVQDVAVSSHVCAVVGDGELRCWGANDAGQLGTTSSTRCVTNHAQPPIQQHPMMGDPPDTGVACSREPLRVPGVPAAAAVAVGRGHSCAITHDGAVWCWGSNDWGQLGRTGFDAAPHPPMHVEGVADVVGISASFSTTCAWQRDGRGYCWGANNESQLGRDTAKGCKSGFACSHTPVHVLDDVAEIGVGFTHVCARKRDGSVWCWGLDHFEQLGLPGDAKCGQAKQACRKTPRRVPGITEATKLAVGHNASCVIERGQVRCWGRNELGALGDGTTQNQREPREIAGPTTCPR